MSAKQYDLWREIEQAASTEKDDACATLAQSRAVVTAIAVYQVATAGFSPTEAIHRITDVLADDNADLIRESIELVREVECA